MANSVQQLINSLERIASLYDELLALLQREKEAALASDMPALVAATDEKRRVLAEIKGRDQGCLQLVKEIAARLNLPAVKTGLAMLAEGLDPLQKREILRINGDLRRKVEKVRLQNQDSRVFFQHCLSLVQNSLVFFNLWGKGSTVYGSSGLLSSGKYGGRMVSNSV